MIMDTNMARKAIENMMFYLFNKFDENESKFLFGDNLGSHLWNTFVNCRFDGFKFFVQCDSEARDLLVARANTIYNK